MDDLNTVPVFGILTEDAKLYGTDEAGCMIYTQLKDAHRILAQLQSTYAESTFELHPLALGTVLNEAGLLATQREHAPQITLVASPEATKEARRLRAAAAAEGKADPDSPADAPRRRANLASVPIFHVGPMAMHGSAHDAKQAGELDASEGTELVWPLFFRTDDIERLWAELGQEATEPPPVEVMNLASLIACLRDPSAAPGKPLVCAPLDALEFVREQQRKMTADTVGIASESDD